MNYVLTFEDGSSAYLEHHGIKGMKWGIWNAETRARRTGQGRKHSKLSPKSKKTLAAIATGVFGVGTALTATGLGLEVSNFNDNLNYLGNHLSDFSQHAQLAPLLHTTLTHNRNMIARDAGLTVVNGALATGAYKKMKKYSKK